MSVSKVKSVVRHSGLFLPFPQVGIKKLKSISLDCWSKLPLADRAPERSAAMVDIVGCNFVALIVDTMQHELRWYIVAERERLWELYGGGILDVQGERSRNTVILSAPFIGADARRQGGDYDHLHCKSQQFMTKTLAFHEKSLKGDGATLAFREESLDSDGETEKSEVPSQWPSSGPSGVSASQSLLTAEGAVSLQGAPVVELTGDGVPTSKGVVVPPS